jgi:hypothetical protein
MMGDVVKTMPVKRKRSIDGEKTLFLALILKHFPISEFKPF